MAEIWDQQPQESGPAFEAFRRFRDAGPARTVPGAYRASQRQKGGNSQAGSQKQAPGSWNKWAKVHKWHERAAAFDARNTQVQQVATEKMVAAVVADRMALVMEQERREHKAAGLLFEKALQMLEMSIGKQKGAAPDGSIGTAAKLLQMAQLLGRAALNMPIRIDPKVSDEAPYFDSSGEMEGSTVPGEIPAMPADVRSKPVMGVSVIGPAGEGLIQPTKARPGNGK